MSSMLGIAPTECTYDLYFKLLYLYNFVIESNLDSLYDEGLKYLIQSFIDINLIKEDNNFRDCAGEWELTDELEGLYESVLRLFGVELANLYLPEQDEEYSCFVMQNLLREILMSDGTTPESALKAFDDLYDTTMVWAYSGELFYNLNRVSHELKCFDETLSNAYARTMASFSSACLPLAKSYYGDCAYYLVGDKEVFFPMLLGLENCFTFKASLECVQYSAYLEGIEVFINFFKDYQNLMDLYYQYKDPLEVC